MVLTFGAKALNAWAGSSRKRSLDPQSARYDFRVFLLQLGLIGDEFKTARKHLLAALPGDSAFKRGRPKPKPKDEPSAPKDGTQEEAGPQTRPPAFYEPHPCGSPFGPACGGSNPLPADLSGDGAAPDEGGEA